MHFVLLFFLKISSLAFIQILNYGSTPFKVGVQGVLALGGHFAKFCQEVDLYEAFFFIINFQKENF